MVTVALVVKLVAKVGFEDEVAALLTEALDLANAEVGTVVWLALRTDTSTFWIVDAFPTDDERNAHLAGPIAAALGAQADRLFVEPPEIALADVLACK